MEAEDCRNPSVYKKYKTVDLGVVTILFVMTVLDVRCRT